MQRKRSIKFAANKSFSSSCLAAFYLSKHRVQVLIEVVHCCPPDVLTGRVIKTSKHNIAVALSETGKELQKPELLFCDLIVLTVTYKSDVWGEVRRGPVDLSINLAAAFPSRIHASQVRA